MSFQRFFPTVAFALLHFGCAGATGDLAEPVGDGAAAILEESDVRLRPISNNGLLPGLLVNEANLVAMQALARGPLGQSTPLADTEDQRTLLAYIARCALPAGQVVVVHDKDGIAYGFDGLVGLAPGWASGPIDASTGRWLSACLLAHANAYGISVKIELVGMHPALGRRAVELTAQEAAFYGDLFMGRPDANTMFACIGSAVGGLSGAPERVCGRSETCGFTITGTCGEPSATPVCSGGPDLYTSCAAVPVSLQPETASEVITVYTDPNVLVTDRCSHPATEVGFPLQASCSAQITAVCETDRYCCVTSWDATCVDEAMNVGPR